jgi:hypothetical protein
MAKTKKVFILFKFKLLSLYLSILIFIINIGWHDKNHQLFTSIPKQNWIIDELHIILRINDTLLENFMSDITSRLKAVEIEKNLIPKITNAMKKNWYSFWNL